MKKLSVFALAIVCAFAFVIGLTGLKTNKADAAIIDGSAPTLGKSMFKISSDGSACMIATAISDFDYVYEVGYEIDESYTPISARTDTYFSAIIAGDKRWTPSLIFKGVQDDDYDAVTGMIVWELPYSALTTYTFNAYALWGAMDDSNGAIRHDGNKATGSVYKLSETYVLSFENGEEDLSGEAKNVTFGSKIGALPVITAKVGYTADCWKIAGTAIDENTVWNYRGDKTATATYTLNPVTDNSDTFAADFLLTSDSDYVIPEGKVNAGFDADDIVAIQYNGADLTYTVDGNNIKFGNAYVKAMGYGDYIIDVFTETDTYKIKVAVVTKVINSVSDFPNVDATTLEGYYIVGSDFDASASASSPVSMLHYTGGYINTETARLNYGFKGIFDGRGHVISNLTVTGGGYAKMGGLFGSIQDTAIIRDVAFTNMKSSADTYKVLFAGESGVMRGRIENVVVTTASDQYGLIFCLREGYGMGNLVGSFENVVFVGAKYFCFCDYTEPAATPANENILVATTERICGAGSEFEAYNVTRYASTNALLTALGSEDVIATWDSPYIEYSSGNIYFNGQKVVLPTVDLSAPNNVVYAGGNMTLTASDSTFALTESIEGVSIGESTGVLTVGAGVAADTEITVRATSTIDTSVFEDITLTVDFEPVDLTSDGVKDIELGSAISVANVSGSVLAIKTPIGSKVTLGTANKVTASELNTAAGVNYSEDLTVTLYTASNAYTVKAAFITKIIRSISDLTSITVTTDTLDGYYVVANDIDASGASAVGLVKYAGNSNDQAKGFQGIFDGRGHVISNIQIYQGGYNAFGGLFGQIGRNGVVKNVALTNVTYAAGYKYILSGESTYFYGTIQDVVITTNDTSGQLIAHTNAGSGTISSKIKNLVITKINMINTDGAGCSVSNIASVTNTDRSGTGGFNWSGNANYNAQKNYTSNNAMLNDLASSNYIAGWSSDYISYSSGSIYFNGQRVVTPTIGLTAPSNEIYAGGNMTLTATAATFDLTESIEGVSIGESTGVLTVGAGVAVDTEITVRATSTIDTGVYEDYVITVVVEPVDLTSDGLKDIELGSAISVANVSGDVLAIKTASGTKVTLGTANKVTAAELNTAASVNWSEGMDITLYTASKAYAVRAAFITKIINSAAELNDVAAYGAANPTAHTGFYVLGSDITGGSINRLSQYCSGSSYTTNGFRGVFDGRGHIIRDVTLNDNRLFDGVGKGAVIKNFALINATSTTDYVLTGEFHNGTVQNVFVSTDRKRLCQSAWDSPTFKNIVFVTTNPEKALFESGSTGTLTITNTLVVDSDARGHGYWGATRTATNHNIYASTAALMDAVTSTTFDGWGSSFTFASGSLYFNGQRVIAPVIGLTAPSNEIYAGNSMTLTASNATFELTEVISGVSIGESTGVLTVGAGVAAGTEITVRATSTIDGEIYEEYTITVALEPVDLTSDGVKDIELGSAISVANVSGDVLAIKTPSGSKVTLGTANKVTASELNTAAGVNYSEDLAITLYTASKAYAVRAAFITKLIHNYSEYSSVASGASRLDGYYVLANNFEANNDTAMNSWSAYTSSSGNGFIGILDGRNHVISNLKVVNYILDGVGIGTIKNIAFVNVTQSNPTSGGLFLFNETHGMTMKNVFVSSTTSGTMCGTTGGVSPNSPYFENVIYVTSNLNGSKNYGLTWTRTSDYDEITFKNVISVTPYANGFYWSGTVNKTNLTVYSSQSALLSGLTTTTFDGWNSPYTFADGKLYFNGTVVLQ